MRVIQFFLTFVFCIQVFGYDTQTLESHLSAAEKQQDPKKLYKALFAEINKVIRETPSHTYSSCRSVINDFINSRYRPGTFPNPGGHSDFVGYSWHIYPKFLRAYAQLKKLVEIDQKYVLQQFQQGVISENLITSLMESLNQAKVIPILASQTNPRYTSHYGFEPLEEYHNKVNKYLLLEEIQFNALRPILEELKTPIAACIGSPWRVVNIRCWKTHPRELQHDASGGWHSDGFPYDAKKIMLYPKGCSYEMGTTQFSDGHNVEGPPGTWLLFENSKIIHRAICPKMSPLAQDRLIVEITIAPDYKFGLEPICAGHLAMWPLTPW